MADHEPLTRPDANSTVEFVGVTKAFGASVAVDNVDLDARGGEFFSLLGPSGCGKTTSLRMLAGFIVPDKGRVLLAGQDVTKVPPYRRDVNTVFQSYALFAHLTVADNVAFGLKRKKVPKAEIRKRVGEMLELVDLGDRAAARPAELSGGQRQRVALARSLVNMPKVLLLDEPLGALDLKLRRQMQVELKRIQREVGITFIYVTHDQEEALTMSDRIAVMNAGRLEQVDVPNKLYESPATAFVAGFIGSSNLLPGSRVADGIRLDQGLVVPVADSAKTAGPHGELVVLSLRPENVVLEGTLTAPGASLQGQICEAVYLGAATQYTVECGGGIRITALEPNGHGNRDPARPVGALVSVSWSAQDSVVLPLTAHKELS
jgi:spermidine/putrescine transport system ATP-binding protein